MASTSTDPPEIALTPTGPLLAEWAASCRQTALLVSPFVNEAVTKLLEIVPSTAQRTLVTRINVRAFATGASRLATLREAAGSGVRVMNLPELHAKVYVFDRRKALITSANATNAGFFRNAECGIQVSDRAMAGHISSLVLGGLGTGSRPSRVTDSRLGEVERAVDAYWWEYSASASDSSESAARRIARSVAGWTGLTLDGVASLPTDEFRVDDLLGAVVGPASRRYPRNRHVREKLRQQLQVLRNMGFVTFLGDGRYRRILGRELIESDGT